MKKHLFLLLALSVLFTLPACSGSNKDSTNQAATVWTDETVPSIKEIYSDQFDSFGIACEYSAWNGIKELSVPEVRKGLSKHANSITMGNEFKPDSFFGYMWSGEGKAMEDFTASNGFTIKVPKTLNYTTADNCLAAAKEAGLVMRGHVLVWHSQTPDSFFAENYKATYNGDKISNLVSKEVMTARQEWYIKTVLSHVAEWEAKNNNGNHIIWAWDVVNEACADDAKNNDTQFLRGSTASTMDKKPSDYPQGSRWYQVYGGEEFIINAFRFANAYAPVDVKLCYNDYNEYMDYDQGWKTTAILKLISKIQNGAADTVNGKSVKPRIDAVGMQSHVGISWPSISGYESALKRYLAVIDVHVTELDLSAKTTAESSKTYGAYFKMLQKYGKNYAGNHQIKNVTIWGITNENSWIYKNDVKFPLLFTKDKKGNIVTTDSFWAVINAHKE